MRGLPTRFTPVPGYVEGLDGLGLGPVDSVCAGRHYTVCCLGPYSGPSLAEKEADDERRKVRSAVRRAAALPRVGRAVRAQCARSAHAQYSGHGLRADLRSHSSGMYRIK